MDPDCGFTFLQDSLTSSSFYAFDEMRKNGELTDFKITFGSRFFEGHRLVVAAAVPYLRKAFCDSEEEITLDEVEPDALESVLDFAYSGRIKITKENVRSLLSASKFLQLDEVHNACWEFLERELRTNNAWEFRTLADDYHRSEIIDIVDDYVCQNFEEFSESKEFLDLPGSYLKNVTSSDLVRVTSEEKVFEALIRWVKVSQSDRRVLLPDLLKNVRFKYLSRKYLTEKVLSEDLIKRSMRCKVLVLEAELYMSSAPDGKERFTQFCTQPRVYETQLPHDLSSGSTDGMYAVCQSKSIIYAKFFDTESENWVNLSTFTDQFLDNVVALNETIYIFLRETILTLNVNTLTWNLLDTVHEPSYSSGVVSHKNRIYLFGGCADLSDRMRCFETKLEEWLEEEKMLKSCENPGVASSGDYIYVTGGMFEGAVYRTSERYHPETKEWSQISEMLSERMSHDCACLDGRIYVCGGYNVEFKNLENGEVYDPLTDQWSFIPPLKEVPWRISMISNNGKLYALETMPTHSKKPVAVQIYDPECDQWEFGVPIRQKDASAIFLASAGTPKVNLNDLKASNSSGDDSDDDNDDNDGDGDDDDNDDDDGDGDDDDNDDDEGDGDLSFLINRTSSDDNEASNDADMTSSDDEESSGNDNMTSSDEEIFGNFIISSDEEGASGNGHMTLGDDKESSGSDNMTSSDEEIFGNFIISSDEEEACGNDYMKSVDDKESPGNDNITSNHDERTSDKDNISGDKVSSGNDLHSLV